MRYKQMLMVISFLVVSGYANASSTNSQEVKGIHYEGTGKTIYFTGVSSWVAIDCPDATYVRVLSSVSGYKDILSIGLSAKFAKAKVSFRGSCHSNPNYFNASYIVVE